MGASASVPATEAEALAQGFTQTQIDEYKQKNKTDEDEMAEECPPAAKANGGCKKGTDVPLLPVPSSEVFQAKVAALKDKLAAGSKEDIAKVLNFAVKIFSMRHPVELGGLLDNLEAVIRAKAGAEDGAIDPNPVEPEARFKALMEACAAGDVEAQYKVAVAAISLISIFHIDQLPMLFPAYVSLGAAKTDAPAQMDVIKTVAMWAVGCFASYHPDVVVTMGLVTADDTPMYCDGEGPKEAAEGKVDEGKIVEMGEMLTEEDGKADGDALAKENAAEAASVSDEDFMKMAVAKCIAVGKDVAASGGKGGKKIGDVAFVAWNSDCKEVGVDKTPKCLSIMIKTARGKCIALSGTKDYKKMTTSSLRVLGRATAYITGASKGMAVGGCMMVRYTNGGEPVIGYFSVSGCPDAKDDIRIARLTLLKCGMAEGKDGIFTAPDGMVASK